MMINYNRHRATIERMYEDRCTISRYIEVTKPNKETKLELQPVYSDQPCRISQKALGTNGQTEAQNNIAYETKLFISPDIEIQQGDEIEVTRGRVVSGGWVSLGDPKSYEAGEPFPYPTHQEISLQRKDKA